MAGLLFLSELFHWPSQCGHKHCLFWLLASLQDWRRSLCWLIAHFCHVGKSGQLMQCAVERKLPVYLFASEDACLLPCDACFLPTGGGGRLGYRPRRNPRPSTGPDPLGASFFSSLNWVHWSGFLFSSLLFLCLFAGKQMKLDRAENRSPEFQRVPITSSGSQVCWPERLVLAEPRPVSPSCFCLSHILLHFSRCDCHSLSPWADSLLTPLIYLAADGCQQLPHFRKLPPMTPKHRQLKSRIDKLYHINIYTSAPQTRPSRKWKDNPRNRR